MRDQMRLGWGTLLTLLSVVVCSAVVSSCGKDGKVAAREYFDSGMHYFEEEEFRKASIQFRNVLKNDPEAWKARYYLALTALHLRRWQRAYQELEAVAEAQPLFVPARLELAELLLQGQKFQEARAEVEAVQAQEPENSRAQVLLAKTYLAEKDFSRALEEFGKAKQLSLDDPLLWTFAGLSRVGLKQHALAEKEFRKAIELDASRIESYRNLANLFRLTGREGRVEPLLKQAIEANPQSLEHHFLLADYYFVRGQLDRVEAFFAQLRKRKLGSPALEARLGEFWLWRNEVARAVRDFEAASSATPSEVVQENLISAYLSLGQLEKAEQLNNALLERNPGNLAARTFRGALAALQDDFRTAVQELESVVEAEPSSLFARYYLGRSWMGLGKPEQAKAAFLECVRLNQGFLHAYAKLAELALQSGDWKAGLEHAQKVLGLNPRSLDGQLLLAQAYMMKGELQNAGSVLRKARKLSPVPAGLYETSAELYALKKNTAAAIAEYERALSTSDRPFETLTRYAALHVSQGRVDRAIQRVREWMEGVPGKPEHFELLSRLYLQGREFRNAEQASRKALDLDAGRWGPYFLLGQIYQYRGQARVAVEHYDESIRRNPSHTVSYLLAGNILMGEGNDQKAKEYFEKASRQNPNSPQVQHALARWYAQRGENLDVALGLVQRLKQQWPEDPHVSDTLGWVYSQKGLFQLALEQLRPAAQMRPDDALIQFHLGMTYFRMGEPNAARQGLERAVELGLAAPANESAAKQTLDQIAGA